MAPTTLSTPALCWAQDPSFSPCGSDTGRVQLSAWCHHNSQVIGIIQHMCVTHSMPDPKLLTGLLKHLLFLGWALARFDRYTEAGTGQVEWAGQTLLLVSSASGRMMLGALPSEQRPLAHSGTQAVPQQMSQVERVLLGAPD